MINACMIDGFGWFEQDDYRRAWLLFDEVDYVFPGELIGPLWYPATVFEKAEYRAVRMSTVAETDWFAQSVEADHGNAELRALVAEIPASDREYACRVVASDSDFEWMKTRYGAHDPVASISALAIKLIKHASQTGTVPIVGKPYACAVLALKTRSSHTIQAPDARVHPPVCLLRSLRFWVDGRRRDVIRRGRNSSQPLCHQQPLRQQLRARPSSERVADSPPRQGGYDRPCEAARRAGTPQG